MRNEPKRLSKLRILLPALGVVAFGAAGAACEDYGDDVAQPSEVEMDTDVVGAGIDSGETVTFEGEVEETYASGAFSIDYERGISQDEILILPGDAWVTPTEEDEVRVTGKLTTMTTVEIEDEFGLDWGDYEADFETEPVIVAQAVNVEEYEIDTF